MRPVRARSLTVLIAAAMAVPAAGASAQVTADVEFEVTGTAASTDLSIAFADGNTTATVPALATGTAGTTLSGALPATIVTDARPSVVGDQWIVQVSTGEHFWNVEETEPALTAGTFAVLRNRAHVYLPTTSTVTNVLGGALTLGTHELSGGDNRLGPQEEAGTTITANHSYTLVSGTSAPNLLGTNRYGYTPQVDIAVPAGQAPGTYAGTITQTLSAVTTP